MTSRRARRKKRNAFRAAALLSGILVLVLAATLFALLWFGKLPRVVPTDGPMHDATAILAVETKETPAPTIAPTATPAPMPTFAFAADSDAPMIQDGERLRLGKGRTLGGTVTCNQPLVRVTAMLVRDYCEDPFYPVIASVSFPEGSGVTSYRLTDASTSEGVSLASLLPFEALQTGVHTLVLTGVCQNAFLPSSEVLSVRFYVLGDEWNRFGKADFNNGSYEAALAFFSGDPERFLYRYQYAYARYTVADPDWESRYITDFSMDGGEPWRIHIDAVPYYERVKTYLNTTQVRVHGSNGDTGILPLSRLVVAYHGSYVSRFTSAKRRYISHHALGTATDLNATMPPNENRPENRALIDHEVRDLLDYRGVATDATAGQYYDFVYSGAYACTDFSMPESVINYLLYELAFYRAGFEWGHYYNSTSDAMHFTLTDNIKTAHDGAKGLKKVKTYYN